MANLPLAAGVQIVTGHIRSFGALRRSDLETGDGCQVWEMPDGALMKFPSHQKEPMLSRIEPIRDDRDEN